MVLAMVTFVPISAQAAAGGGITERDSLSTANVQATGASGAPAITPDARFVAFESAASNLVAGDTNNVADIFVRDRRAPASTERVSVDTAGVAGAGGSTHPSISADGRYVAFTSGSQLTSLPSLGNLNVYVRDRTLNTTQLVSVGLGGVSANNDSYEPAISANGRYVAFTSTANNLITAGQDTNTDSDIFVRDLQTGTTTRVSVGAGSGVVSSAEYLSISSQPAISGDGRYVAFAKQLDVSSPGQYYEIWVRDTVAGSSTRLSVPSLANGTVNGSSYNPVISQDGAFVAFDTDADNLKGSEASHGVIRVKLSDLSAQLVSQSTGGVPGNDVSEQPAISADGRYVAFRSVATNLATDVGAFSDIFVRDCTNSSTVLQSVSTAGTQGNGDSILPAISGDGTFIAFESASTNLVASDTNGVDDVFARLIDGTPPVTTLQASPVANAAGWWNAASVSVTLVPTDTGTGVASTSYTVNGAGAQAYLAPFSVNTEGTTSLTYYSTDAAGNVEVAKSASIKIDRTLPGLTLSPSSAGSYSAPFVVTATPSDALSGIDTARDVEMNLDGGGWTKTRSLGVPVGGGSHTVDARVFDNAGNEKDASVAGIQVTASAPDTTAPRTALADTPTTTWVNQATAPKLLVATDAVSGVTTTNWGLVNPPASILATAAKSVVSWAPILVSWQPGVNTLWMSSTDAANNVETPHSVVVNFDNTAPSVSIPAQTYNTGPLNIHATVSDPLSGVSSQQIALDNGPWQSGADIAVGLGPHTVSVQATDNAGNSTGRITSASFSVVAAPIKSYNTSLKLSGPSSLRLRSTFALRGTITPAAAPGQIYMTFYLLKGSRWANYGRAKVAISSGKFAFNYKPPKRGKWRVYASYSRVDAGSAIYNKALTVRKDFTVK
jgi:hypothetical protein